MKAEYIRAEDKDRSNYREKDRKRDRIEGETEKKNKKAQLNLRLSQAEKKRLKKEAAKSDLNLSEYIRIRLLENGENYRSPGMVNQCMILCQDILNIVEEKYSYEDNSLLEEKVERLWKIFS